MVIRGVSTVFQGTDILSFQARSIQLNINNNAEESNVNSLYINHLRLTMLRSRCIGRPVTKWFGVFYAKCDNQAQHP